MNVLLEEITEYIKMIWGEEDDIYTNVTKEQVEQCVVRYDEFEKALVPKGHCKEYLRRYINLPLMVYDMHQESKIIIVQCDYINSDSESDETDSCFSEGEYDYDEREFTNYVNGVKLLDEGDLREQITANEFTGGYLEPYYHWVAVRARLDEVLKPRNTSE